MAKSVELIRLQGYTKALVDMAVLNGALHSRAAEIATDVLHSYNAFKISDLSTDDYRIFESSLCHAYKHESAEVTVSTPAPPKTPEKTNTSILTEADGLIHGDRAESYGPVAEQFTKIGNVAAELINKKEWGVIHNEELLPPTVIAKIMTATKLVRESYKPKKDNRRDAAGYLGLWDTLEDGE